MKTAGIVLVIFGSLSLLGFLLNPTGGASAGGLVFIVLGAYLIYRAKQKKKEQQDKQDWSNGETDNEKRQRD